MLGNPSLVTRIGVGKAVGFVFGLLGFIFMPYVLPDPDILLRWGILFWYITMGAIIGVFGVFTWHPVLHLPMPWWLRAPAIGAWLNFVLVLFVYDTLKLAMTHTFGEGGLLQSPFWVVLEGAIIGLLIGFFATRFGGEGKETIGK